MSKLFDLIAGTLDQDKLFSFAYPEYDAITASRVVTDLLCCIRLQQPLPVSSRTIRVLSLSSYPIRTDSSIDRARLSMLLLLLVLNTRDGNDVNAVEYLDHALRALCSSSHAFSDPETVSEILLLNAKLLGTTNCAGDSDFRESVSLSIAFWAMRLRAIVRSTDHKDDQTTRWDQLATEGGCASREPLTWTELETL